MNNIPKLIELCNLVKLIDNSGTNYQEQLMFVNQKEKILSRKLSVWVKPFCKNERIKKY